MALFATERNIKAFLSRLSPQESGCIHHTGSLSSSGYPQATIQSDTCSSRSVAYPAHRVAWVIAHGDIPRHVFICHKCDNKRCVNLAHLYAGSHKENMDDISKSKSHPRRKLREEQVVEIRKLAAMNMPTRAISRMFSVDKKTIFLIIRNVTYRHDGS